MGRRTIAGLMVTGFCLAGASGAPAQDYANIQHLYVGDTSIVDEPILYPTEGKAEIRLAIITLLAGEETAWHRHDVPLFAYILKGELTVDYGEHGVRRYQAGTAYMEAMAATHRGRNHRNQPCRILAVFMGYEGAKLSPPAPAPR